MAVNCQARSGFRFAKPSLLAPLIPLETPQATNEQANNGQQVPQTTRGALQLPITPLGGQADFRQVTRQNQLTLAPMTPQMGGNIAYQRRQPVRPCLDETVNNERFGVCIRKTNYRKQQEDRVSIIYNIIMENTSNLAVVIT